MPTPMRISRLRIAQEAAGSSTFAVELSGSIGSFQDVQHREATFTIPNEMLPNEARVQRNFQTRKHVVGAKSTELTIPHDVTPTGTALIDNVYSGSAPTDPTFALGVIYQTILGAYYTEEGSTEDSGASSTTSVINVATGHGSRWVDGSVIGATVGGVVEARQVRSISTDAITPTVQFSAAPTDSSVVYNAHVFYPKRNGSSTTSLQAIVEEDDRDNLWWLLGLQAQSLSFELGLRQLARGTVQLRGPKWLQDDDVGTPLGSGALAAGTLTDGDPIPVLDGDLLFQTGAYPQSLTSLDASEVTFTPRIQHDEVPSLGGVQGTRRWELNINEDMATATFTIPSASSNVKTYKAAQEAGTEYSWQIQIGNVAGSIVFVAMPRVQITDVQPADSSGFHGVQVTVRALENDADTATDLGAAPFVLALL